MWPANWGWSHAWLSSVSRPSVTPFPNGPRRWAARRKVLDEKGVDFEYDGEMTVDVAINPAVMEHYPFCRLTGPANVLVVPARHSASISVKLMQEMAGATVIGPILTGLDRPVQIGVDGVHGERHPEHGGDGGLRDRTDLTAQFARSSQNLRTLSKNPAGVGIVRLGAAFLELAQQVLLLGRQLDRGFPPQARYTCRPCRSREAPACPCRRRRIWRPDCEPSGTFTRDRPPSMLGTSTSPPRAARVIETGTRQ